MYMLDSLACAAAGIERRSRIGSHQQSWWFTEMN